MSYYLGRHKTMPKLEERKDAAQEWLKKAERKQIRKKRAQKRKELREINATECLRCKNPDGVRKGYCKKCREVARNMGAPRGLENEYFRMVNAKNERSD